MFFFSFSRFICLQRPPFNTTLTFELEFQQITYWTELNIYTRVERNKWKQKQNNMVYLCVHACVHTHVSMCVCVCGYIYMCMWAFLFVYTWKQVVNAGNSIVFYFMPFVVLQYLFLKFHIIWSHAFASHSFSHILPHKLHTDLHVVSLS